MQILEEIQRLTAEGSGSAIITFHSDRWQQVFDLKVDGNQARWGYEPSHQLSLMSNLYNQDNYPISIVVRVFLREWVLTHMPNGKKMLLPKKRMHMFYCHDQNLMHKLSPEDCFACMNTDSATGEPLPIDPLLIYS